VTAMDNTGVPVEHNLTPPRATMGRRGLSVVDTFLVLAALYNPTSLSWLYMEMMRRYAKYSKRAIRWALDKLVNAGYVVHEGRYYAPAPTVSASQRRFFIPAKPGIAEVDLLLLVLSGFREPRRPFLILWGGGEPAGRVYRGAMRRLVRSGYLERSRDWRYNPTARTVALLTPVIQ